MAQKGCVWRKGSGWFLKYRENVNVNGQIIRKQMCVKLADYGDRYRCEKASMILWQKRWLVFVRP